MLTQSERSKSKFILLKFIYLKNFNNLHVKHENLTKMKMGFFFHFFFFVYHAHVDMTVASLGSSHSSAQRFERFPKKKLNNKYMKLNKIHLTVHVTSTTSFMTVH